MAEILFDSKDSKVLVDPDSGNYAVRKNDTIIATGKEIADKAFNAIKNAMTGLTHIFDVGSKKVSKRDHEGNTVAQWKMTENEVGKFSSFLAAVGKNIEKGLSKLGKGGKVAMVVSAMLLTAAMSQQLQAATYVKGGTMEDIAIKAIENPGKVYLAEFENIRDEPILVLFHNGSDKAQEALDALKEANVIKEDYNVTPGKKNPNTYIVSSTVTEEFKDYLKAPGTEIEVHVVEAAQEQAPKQNENKGTSIKVAPHLEYKGYKIDAKTAGYYNQDNKFVSFTKAEVEKLQKCYDETFDAIKKREIEVPAGMTAQSCASLKTSSLAAKMASEKETRALETRNNTNTSTATQAKAKNTRYY